MDRDTSALAQESLSHFGLGGARAQDASAKASGEKYDVDQALVVTQGRHRFYSFVLPSDVLAACCTVDARADNPIDGFQRRLDAKRAKEIAKYIDSGFGTAPCAVVLSAQPRAHLQFDRASGALRFRKDLGAFLIIDGQHRIFGFHLAKSVVNVPVVVYNKLTRAQECQLFMDINTKQRPVPAELLLDIRRLSQVETKSEALMHDVFDLFEHESDSALKGLMSPSERRKGMITRVSFNAALKSINGAFVDATPKEVYGVLNAYLKACVRGLAQHEAEANISNTALFKALVLLFPSLAERVAERSGAYTVANFEQILLPFFRRLKKSDLPKAGMGHLALHEFYSKALVSGFSLKQWLFA